MDKVTKTVSTNHNLFEEKGESKKNIKKEELSVPFSEIPEVKANT